jgi:Protein of unknown function (DUF2927)
VALYLLVSIATLSTCCPMALAQEDGATVQTGRPPRVSSNEVADRLSFRIGAFPVEYVTKWNGDIHVVFLLDRSIQPDLLATAATDIEKLEAVTKHHVDIADNANFVVVFSRSIDETSQKHGSQLSKFFVDRDSYDAFLSKLKAGNESCGSHMLLSQKKSIGAYLLVILTQNNDADMLDAKRCLLRGLIKGLGVLGKGIGVQSAIELHRGDDVLSALDTVALTVLYDPAIQAGATRIAATPTIAKILSERADPTKR